MARIRSIHPGLFTDEAFVSLSADAQIFLLGLWTEADDQGMFEWKPLTLRMRLRPTKDGSVDALLEEAVAALCIKRFEIGGRSYGAIRNFRKFQRPKKPNAIHPMTDEVRTYVALTTISSELDEVEEHEVIPVTAVSGEKSPQMEDEGGRVGKEEGDKKTDSQGEPALIASDLEVQENQHFKAFFDAFPKKENPAEAEPAYFAALAKGATHAVLLDGARRYAAHIRSTKQEIRWVLQAKKWLSKDGWLSQYGAIEQPLAAVTVDPSWGDAGEKLSAAINPGNFGSYFAAAEFVDSDPPRIRFKKQFTRDLAERKFSKPLKQVFGEIALEVAA